MDEGDRTRRTAIGFSTGQSDVRAMAQVFYVAPGAEPRLLQEHYECETPIAAPRHAGLAVDTASAASSNAGRRRGEQRHDLVSAGRADVGAEAKRLQQADARSTSAHCSRGTARFRHRAVQRLRLR